MKKRVVFTFIIAGILITFGMIVGASKPEKFVGQKIGPTAEPLTGIIPVVTPSPEPQPNYYDIQLENLKKSDEDIYIVFTTFDEESLHTGFSIPCMHIFYIISETEYDCVFSVELEYSRQTADLYQINEFDTYRYYENDLNDKLCSEGVTLDLFKNGKKIDTVKMSFELGKSKRGYTELQLVSAQSQKLKIKTINWDGYVGE